MGWWQRRENSKNALAEQNKKAEADKKKREHERKLKAAQAERDKKTIAAQKKQQEAAEKKKKRKERLAKDKPAMMEKVKERASKRVGVKNKPNYSSSSSKPAKKTFIKKPKKK